MITLTPISSFSSAASTSKGGCGQEPIAYLLEIDEERILLDCGGADYRVSKEATFWEYEEKIKELAPTISLLLLSHSPSQYLSLYPYARAHWGLQCPVYSTQPTADMGRLVCLSEAESWRSQVATASSAGPSKFTGPFVSSVEEIHEAFNWITQIRYNQPVHLGGKLAHLLLTPYASGHTLGGSLFKIRSPTSGTLLYAVGINHTQERHLDGMIGGQGQIGYAEGVMRPDVLVIEAGRSLVTNAKKRDRESALLDIVTSTLLSSHTLLIPCDPSPRLFELLILLDQHWAFKTASSNNPKSQSPPWIYPLCVVSKTAADMIAIARSSTEYMGGVVTAAPEGEDDEGGKRKGRRNRNQDTEHGALQFRHVRFFPSEQAMHDAFPPIRPKLILAVPPTMSYAPSRSLFTSIAQKPGNVVLLTGRGEDGSLARDLFEKWDGEQDEAGKWGAGKVGAKKPLKGNLDLEMNFKVPLEGAELEAHLETERLAKEKEAAIQAAENRSRQVLEADDFDSDSGSEDDVDEAVDENAKAQNTEMIETSFDIYVKGQRVKGAVQRFRMFPFTERRGRKLDAYGEGLDVGAWVRKGREIEEEGETEEVRDAKKRKVEEEERKKIPPEPPSKFVTDQAHIHLDCELCYIDMEGLHDGQAIKTIIADLQPRKLVLVRSAPPSTEALQTFFSTATFTKDVFAPRVGETVTIGEHVHSYSVNLGEALAVDLKGKWSKFEDFEVAMVSGNVIFSADTTVPILEAGGVPIKMMPAAPTEEEDTKAEADASEMEDIKPDITAQPEALPEKPTPSGPAPLPSSLFVGDLRLANLKAKLTSLSIPAEFAGQGVLICGPGVPAKIVGEETSGEIVAVKKLAEGEIVLEGAACQTYFDVRRELYGSYAQVTA